jgi:PAS domain S-box-containing protein
MIFTFLANNLAAILAVSLLYGALIGRKEWSPFVKRILNGLFFSIASLMVMVNAYEFSTGVIFDSRSVMLSVAGLFCGPLTASVAAVFTALYRIRQGGEGLLAGLLVIFTSSAIGCVFYYLRKSRPYLTNPLYLYLFGLIVHLAVLPLMFVLPYDIAAEAISVIALPFILLFPFGTVLLGMMLTDQQKRANVSKDIAQYNSRLLDANKKLRKEISDRQRTELELHESEEHFKRAVTESPMPIMIHASDGEIVHISKAWAELSGYNFDEISSVNEWIEKAHGEKADSIKELVKSFYKDHSAEKRDEYEIKTANGDVLIWDICSVTIGKLSDSRVIVMTMASDITERKEVEQELREARDKAEDINRYLEIQTMFANDMAAKAEAANIAKSQFLANMSHEIRTPMNAIIGFGSFLLTEELTETQKKDVDIIVESSNILLSLIDDILDFSKIEAGQIDVELVECSTDKLLYSLESLMRHRTTEKKLEFKVLKSPNVPPVIYTDPTRLNQCLINILSNAIKFTSNGHVYLPVSAEMNRGENFVCFNVEDTGIGIPKDKQKIIFEPFRQVDGSTTRKYGGTGLGLTITKDLVELLGGTLALESVEGEGSVFSLSIPVGDYLCEKLPSMDNPINDIAQNDTEIEMQSFEGNVLVAEDARTNQVFIKRLLEKFGFKVTIVEDGSEAVRNAMRKDYRVIFMDMQMPKMNGYEAAGLLRKQNIRTPIIALTANAMKGDEEKCLQAGCDGYLAKPVSLSDVNGILVKILGKDN